MEQYANKHDKVKNIADVYIYTHALNPFTHSR